MTAAVRSPGPSVVVIGAGAIGLAMAVQLARAGITRVVVLDRNPAAGMGSTGRANGGVRAQFASPVNVRFSQYTIALIAKLDAATATVAYRPVGYLFMTGSGERVAGLRQGYEMQRSLGEPVRWLGRDEVAALAPCLRLDGIAAATFNPRDGLIDPHGFVAALSEEGRRLGVTYRFGTQVSGLAFAGGRAVVRTTDGVIDADVVVNAAGPHARNVAMLAGVDLPVLPYRRNLVCTEAVEGVPDNLPMCVDVDTGVLVRREGPGVVVGYSDPNSAPTDDDAFEPAFLDVLAERVGNRFPFLHSAGINPRKCWAGLYPETRDHHAVIDAPAQAPWFIQCAGFGGHGIMHSLAAGQAVTELVRDGSCTTFDLQPLRLDRFDQATLVEETAIL